MDYEKKYKEALEWARKVMQGEVGFVLDEVLEKFPELAESEDERIRKNCIHFLELQKQHHAATFEIEECIVWLEKQGEQKLATNIIETWKDMRLEVYQQASGNRHEPNCSDDTTKMFSLNDIDEIVEKMSEQKPADKIEPKFHECEWITNGDYTWKIVEVKPLDYILQSQDGNIVDDTIYHVDEQFHSFAIEDAKDGDVLVYKDEISLYKHDIKNCTKEETTFGGFVYHCCYDGKRFVVDSIYSLTEQDKMDIHPATKEQRDQLEKAMADAGYRWNQYEKKMEKIEQKPAWSEEDETMLKRIINFIPQCMTAHGYNEYINWLKSLRPQNWKPSDEHLHWLEWAINRMPDTEKANEAEAVLEELLEQLKKLK